MCACVCSAEVLLLLLCYFGHLGFSIRPNEQEEENQTTPADVLPAGLCITQLAALGD